METGAGPLPTLEDWRLGGRRFEFSGHEIFWREEGQGPALLLIHGFPTASWDWRALWTPLCERYRVLCADLLGFGFSAKPAGHRYRIAEQADLIEALLAARQVGHYHVLAHDYGVTVAQELLARQREHTSGGHLDSVCFLNGGLFPEAYRPLAVQRWLAGPLGPLVARLLSRQRFETSMRHIFSRERPPTEEELDGFWWLLERANGRRAIPRLIRYMRERKTSRGRWVGAMRTAQVPLRLVYGKADPISGPRMIARYRELIPQPDVVELEGTGHYPQIEVPAAVHGALLEFHARGTRTAGNGVTPYNSL